MSRVPDYQVDGRDAAHSQDGHEGVWSLRTALRGGTTSTTRLSAVENFMKQPAASPHSDRAGHQDWARLALSLEKPEKEAPKLTLVLFTSEYIPTSSTDKR